VHAGLHRCVEVRAHRSHVAHAGAGSSWGSAGLTRRALLRTARNAREYRERITLSLRRILPGECTLKCACALTCSYVPKRTPRRGSFGGSALVERQADDLIARVFRTCWRSRARVVLVQRVGGALVVGVGEACALGPEDLLPVESHTHDFIGRYRTREGSPRRALSSSARLRICSSSSCDICRRRAGLHRSRSRPRPRCGLRTVEQQGRGTDERRQRGRVHGAVGKKLLRRICRLRA
jgi:hypothetical protein